MDKVQKQEYTCSSTKHNEAKRRYEFVAIIKEWIYPKQAEIIMEKIEEIKDLLKDD